MTLQEKLAQRIYELLPHKKELEFGCQFIDNSDTDKKPYTIVMRDNVFDNFGMGKNEIWSVPFYTKGYIPDYAFEDEEDYQIIGQPLRLADLLMAIEKVLDDNHICYVNSVGAVYVLDMNKSYQKQFEDTNYGEYNLSKDNILDQSDDLCSFCLELLK